MAVDVILFGECSGSHRLSNEVANRNFIKSSALLRLGHYLRRSGETVFQVHHFSSFTHDELKQLIETHVNVDTKVLGISTTFISPVKIKSKPEDVISPFSEIEFNRIQFILQTAKAIAPNIKVVLGGPHCKKLRLERPKDCARWRFDTLRPLIDYMIEDQGEVALAMICKNNIPLFEEVNGFKLIDGGLLPVLDFSENANSPAPIIDGIQYGEALSTELAHGCIFNCEFCGHGRVLGKKIRHFSRSFDSLKTEIVYNFENFGTSFYMFLDDMVNDDPNKLEWLKQIRTETGIPVEWVSYARLEVIKTEAHVQQLKDAGCRGIYFGIESLRADVGPKIGKITDPVKVKESLRLVRKVFGESILVKASMIVGLPGETLQEFKESTKWMMQSEEGQYLIDRVSISALAVYREDKGSLSASRNHPFAQYVLDPQEAADYSAAPNWTSPWSTRDECLKILPALYSGVNPHFHNAHPFYFPMYVNFGIDLGQYIRTYRARTFESVISTAEIHRKCNQFIGEYKDRLLNVTSEQVNEQHEVFWKTFPKFNQSTEFVLSFFAKENNALPS